MRRLRNPADVRAKRVAVTPDGLKELGKALPAVIDVQEQLFGDEGKPGGSLLTTLLRFDGRIT